jgi:hypothetical protein
VEEKQWAAVHQSVIVTPLAVENKRGAAVHQQLVMTTLIVENKRWKAVIITPLTGSVTVTGLGSSNGYVVCNVIAAGSPIPTAGTTTEGSTANVGGLINSPNIGDDFNTGKAFLSTDDNGVETLVLKYNTGNFNDIGLNQQSGAYTDPQDPNAVVVPVKNLWTLKDTNYTTRNLQPEAGKASEFKAATFTDEGGRQFTGVPTRVYKDQLGNLWLDLTVGSGKSASELHVPLQTGDYVKQKWGRRTDKDGNKIYENTKLNEAAEANQGAIATSMGLKGDDKIANFNLFIGKYGPQLEAR